MPPDDDFKFDAEAILFGDDFSGDVRELARTLRETHHAYVVPIICNGRHGILWPRYAISDDAVTTAIAALA